MANRNRKNPVYFHLSDIEMMILNEKIKESGLSKSTFLRKMITDGYVIKYDFDSVKEISSEMNKVAEKIPISELNRIGNNINQIAKYVNESQGAIVIKQINELLEEHRKVVELVDNIQRQHDKILEVVMGKILNVNDKKIVYKG